MSSARRNGNDDRVFVRNGRRPYRRSYSVAEVRWGAVVLVFLALVFFWVAWKGGHPDPKLFTTGIDPLRPGSAAVRGPLGGSLAPAGWTEGAVSEYDTSNVYEKIDGREDYYRAYGFERLFFLTLTSDIDIAKTIDIELFDLSTAANALGAYAGERPGGITPEISSSGMAHVARNALFLTRGKYYARVIGSDESPQVLDALARLRTSLEGAIEGEPLPWAYALFSGRLGIDPGKVTFLLGNAFSFDFARYVYTATVDDDGGRLFVSAARDEDSALTLAARFNAGFLEYGKGEAVRDGVEWVRDRYIGRLAACTAAGPWVIGMKGAVDLERGAEELARLRSAVALLPGETHRLALEERRADESRRGARAEGVEDGEGNLFPGEGGETERGGTDER